MRTVQLSNHPTSFGITMLKSSESHSVPVGALPTLIDDKWQSVNIDGQDVGGAYELAIGLAK
jgi:hypothetical protein